MRAITVTSSKVRRIKCSTVLVFIFSFSIAGHALSQSITSVITTLLLEPCPIKTIPPLPRCTPPVLETQQDVNAFKSVEVVQGHLQIAAKTNLDLSPFDKLREVQGILYLDNGNLTSIIGFNNLESVGARANLFGFGHQIYIDSNPQLTSISGFQKLKNSNHPESRPPSIFIRSNPLLRTISGFNALDAAGSISIRFNTLLTSVTGFDSLQTLNGSLLITNSNGLTSLPPFSNLRTVGPLDLYNLPNLNTMPRFQALTSALTVRVHNLGISELRSFNNSNFLGTRSLSITRNRNLVLMSGFDYMKSIEGERGDIFISRNLLLDNVTGFKRLDTNDPTDYISVSDNPLLNCPAELFMLEDMAYSQSNQVNCSTTPYDF